MILSVFERLVILNMFKDESDITTLRCVRNLKQSIGFRDEELKDLNFQPNEGGGTKWNNKAVGEKEFDISPRAHTLIGKTFQELSSQKKMTMALLTVYERFEEKKED